MMDKVIYVKYNRERLPQFQTETSVIQSEQGFYVKKRPLSRLSIEHVAQIYKNFNFLKQKNNVAQIAKAKLSGDCIYFEYISGETLNAKLLNIVRENDKEKFIKVLDQYMSYLVNLGSEKLKYYKSDEKFDQMFGITLEAEEVICLNIANMDLICDNIIIDVNNIYTMIDYEWVFDFSIPIKFILFRALNVFYTNNQGYLKGFHSIEDLYSYYEIDAEMIKEFTVLEQKFQDYVFGEVRINRISEKYLKAQHQLSELTKNSQMFVNQEARIQEVSNWGKQLEAEVIERDKLIMEQNIKLEEVSKWAQSLMKQLEERQ